MRRTLITAFLVLSGCATVSTVDTPLETISKQLTDVEFAVVAHQEPKMYIATPGDLGPGLIDSLTDLRGVDGSEQSVSSLLAKDLADKLAREGSLQFRGDVQRRQQLVNPQLDSNPAIPNTLEVSITANHLGYRPTAWRTYQYMLYAQARLSDNSGTVVWKKSCKIGGTAANEVLQFQRSETPDLNREGLARVVTTAIDRCSAQLVHGSGI